MLILKSQVAKRILFTTLIHDLIVLMAAFIALNILYFLTQTENAI